MQRHARNPFNRCFRVFLNDVEVTKDCRSVDVSTGEVTLYRRNEKGGVHLLYACACETTMLRPRPCTACKVCRKPYHCFPALYIDRGEVRLKLRPLRECLRILLHPLRVKWESFRLRQELVDGVEQPPSP